MLDWRAHDPELAATLAAGLRPSSRSVMKMQGVKANLQESLAALVHDDLQAIICMLSGKKHAKPKFIAKKVISGEKKKTEYETFDSPEAFWTRWNSL